MGKNNQNQTPSNSPLSGGEQRAGDEQAGNPSTGSGRTDVLVAYHAGPESIGFCGRVWQRGVAQSVTAEEWAAMRARGDFDEFDFTEEN